MQKDNLFDTKITPLDVVKILLLIVTMFSTWNIIDMMTPDSSFAFVREFAAVGVVEGAFLGFEYATKDAKNRKQMQISTIGFFCSLLVIVLFAGVSGLVEFGGETLLRQSAGLAMGIQWTVRDMVMVFALLVTVGWIFGLASIYRVYALEDPDKRAELDKNQIDGDMRTKSNQALRDAMTKAAPVISIQRALTEIRAQYSAELTPAQLDALLSDVETHLKANLHNAPSPAPSENLGDVFAKMVAAALSKPGAEAAKPDDQSPLPGKGPEAPTA